MQDDNQIANQSTTMGPVVCLVAVINNSNPQVTSMTSTTSAQPQQCHLRQMPAACRHLLLPSIHEPVHRWASDQAVGNMVSRLSHDSSIEQYRGTYVIADILHVRVKFQLSPNNPFVRSGIPQLLRTLCGSLIPDGSMSDGPTKQPIFRFSPCPACRAGRRISRPQGQERQTHF